jgi:GYF domain 2
MQDGGELAIRLIFMCIFGAACAGVAHSKGRNPWGWFFVGFLITCVGLIIILCLPNLNEQKALMQVQEDTNRRLREQLRQEQMKVEALRAHTAARLDAHDEVLGINTRSAAPALAGGVAPPMLGNESPSVLMPAALTPPDDGTAWYYADDHSQQHGPMSIVGLRGAITSNIVRRDTLIWHEGLTDWTPAGQLKKLAALFS